MDALDILKKSTEHGFRYKFIFTDFNMPRLGGIDTVIRIREYYNHLNFEKSEQPRIVGVTGNVQDEYVTQGKMSGMDQILSKPLYASTLKRVLSS